MLLLSIIKGASITLLREGVDLVIENAPISD